jgi:hypothetical protein
MERSMSPIPMFGPRTLLTVVFTVIFGGMFACAPDQPGARTDEVVANLPPEESLEAALAGITEAEIREHTRILASDDFGGRAPSSPGEEKTMEYLSEQFGALGLEPGGVDGTWFQEVPLVSITADPDTPLTISGSAGTATFAYGPEFAGGTPRVVEDIAIEGAEMVFVGYGAVAPEYDWNDYAGVDVDGKVVVVLVNDPGFATQDPDLFKGNAMTYYGRWTYKYEEGARQGAAGILIVHETAPAAYGWATVRNGWTGPQFNLVTPDNNMGMAMLEGWITLETAEAIFEMAGMDYQEMKAMAETREFRAVPLGDLRASVSVHNTIQESTSRNFLARTPGTTRP